LGRPLGATVPLDRQPCLSEDADETSSDTLGASAPEDDRIEMKIIVLHGSARTGGDTDTLAEQFLKGLGGEEKNEITHVRPIEMEIAHCRGATCMACSSGNGCIIQDDMQAVYPALRDAHVVVLAAPMFWGYMTSQLKTLFDRLEAVVSPDYFGGKDFVLLIGYRHYHGSILEWMSRIANGFGSRAHAVLAQTCDATTGTDSPIRQMPEKLEEAFDLGAEIARRATARQESCPAVDTRTTPPRTSAAPASAQRPGRSRKKITE
jgi:multimeric flavodoxin WrbA